MVSNEEKAQLSFLLSGVCDVIPSSYFKLRSYLNIHLSNLADQQNLNLPKSFRSRNKTCPYCYSSWSGDTSSFKLLPSKKSKLRQTQNEKEKMNKEDQINESRNTLMLKCKVCTNKSFFSLVKRKPNKEIVKEIPAKSVKKKKKKKDKYCGLFVNFKGDSSVPEISKKKKRSKNTKQNKNSNSACKLQTNFSGPPKNMPKDKSNSISDKNKKLVQNPFASQFQGKFSKKKENFKEKRKLQSLKKAVKGEKGLNSAKKTLKDFLTLI